ncbi:hypothetical protein HPB51_011391 [Rhipicephalus microplus]|uniref:Uncharacterized protein n=1 Tax=Rhipicephalus microplus TaxID=6941 RepID=A0A9J6F1P4_RHIMP|nr:hypothetical protein HPB51_011391 [Rhipicephalus microplus]
MKTLVLHITTLSLLPVSGTENVHSIPLQIPVQTKGWQGPSKEPRINEARADDVLPEIEGCLAPLEVTCELPQGGSIRFLDLQSRYEPQEKVNKNKNSHGARLSCLAVPTLPVKPAVRSHRARVPGTTIHPASACSVAVEPYPWSDLCWATSLTLQSWSTSPISARIYYVVVLPNEQSVYCRHDDRATGKTLDSSVLFFCVWVMFFGLCHVPMTPVPLPH